MRANSWERPACCEDVTSAPHVNTRSSRGCNVASFAPAGRLSEVCHTRISPWTLRFELEYSKVEMVMLLIDNLQNVGSVIAKPLVPFTLSQRRLRRQCLTQHDHAEASHRATMSKITYEGFLVVQ